MTTTISLRLVTLTDILELENDHLQLSSRGPEGKNISLALSLTHSNYTLIGMACCVQEGIDTVLKAFSLLLILVW